MKTYTIGRLALKSGVDRETIRYYETEGLLRLPPRTTSGYRMYPASALQRLQFIKRAKQLGFRLKEIKELLSLEEIDGPRAEVKAITHAKLEEIRSKLDDLKRMEGVLVHLAYECSGKGKAHGCPIIEALIGPPGADS